MIEVIITDDMLLKARSMSTEMGALNNSITRGAGNIYGFLGELIYNEVAHGEHKNTYEFDIVLDNGSTVDVKTKKTSVRPKPDYECSVSGHNTKQKCDIYGFTRVKDDMSMGWVLGSLSKEDFFKKATHYKKGDVDPSNGFTVRTDCYSVKINELNAPE